jgi:hypothetical protein
VGQTSGDDLTADSGGVEIEFIDGSDAPVQHKTSERMVVMRDSKKPGGPALYFTEAEWEAFIGGVKDGEFDDMLEPDYDPEADRLSGSGQ